MKSNIGVIILDTLRYDTFINEMSHLYDSSTHTYDQMYTTARWTSPAHASLFTGYYPTEIGVYAGQPHFTTPKPALAEQLRDAGYHTVGLTENINIDSFFDFDRGFNRFFRSPGLQGRPAENVGGYDWKRLEKKIPNSGLRRPLKAAYHILKSNSPALRTLRTGFKMYRANNTSQAEINWATDKINAAVSDTGDSFLFANFMTPHYPYNPPSEYSPCEPLFTSPMELTLRDNPVTEREHERHLSNYLGAARYLNDALPGLIQQIDWDLLFIISDHGELFGEHSLRGHQYGMYEELVHVPAVAFGDLVSDGTTTRVTSLIDIHRTLLEVADVDADGAHRGINLLHGETDEDRVVYAESEGSEWYSPDAEGIEARIPSSWDEPHYMVRSEDAMLLVDKDGTRTIDPETAEEKPERHPDLQRKARKIRSGRGDYSGDTKDRKVPDDVKARLEQLGYR